METSFKGQTNYSVPVCITTRRESNDDNEVALINTKKTNTGLVKQNRFLVNGDCFYFSWTNLSNMLL